MENETKREKEKLHYAWLVCAGCALLLFCTSGLCVNAFTIYQPYILRENGFTNAQSSLIVTVRSLTGFGGMLLCGWYYRRLSLRAGMAAAGAMAAGGFFFFGAANSLVGYYAAAALVGLGYGFGTMIPVSVVMERWFIRDRNLAVGVCASVTGLSTLGIPTLLTHMIESWGLRRSFYAEGAFIAALVFVSFLLIRSRPADVGRMPYGEWSGMEEVSLPARTGRLTGKSWVLLVPVLLAVGAYTSVGYSHLTVLIKGEGFSSHTAALAITISGVALILGKSAYGLLSERISAFWANWLFGGILTLGLILCCVSGGSRALLYFAMTAYGLGLALGTVGLTAWAGDLSSPERYDDTVRLFQIGYGAGGLLFSTLPGIMADMAGGSYVPAYMFFTGCALFSILAIQFIYMRCGGTGRQ